MYCRLFQALATVRAVLIVFQFAGAVTTTILMTTWRAGNIFPHPHLILQLASYFLLSSRMLSRTCGVMDVAAFVNVFG